MFNSLIKSISKLMGGSKSERDVKEIQPFIDEILSIYAGLNTLTNDQLRNKTTEFRKKINDYISEEQKEIAELKAEAENPETDIENQGSSGRNSPGSFRRC
jgi:preprotein translocase subunit SecA